VIVQPDQTLIKYKLEDGKQQKQREGKKNDSAGISFGLLFFQKLSPFRKPVPNLDQTGGPAGAGPINRC